MSRKQILVAPLNWGLGHAARCIPIIKALEAHGFQPIIGSDGQALELLRQEFPHLAAVELPSYRITYSKKGKYFKLKLIKDSPKVIKAIKHEKKVTKQLIEDLEIDGIISDNRLGVHSKHVPSVFISHQLNVLSGTTTWFSSKFHQHFIKKFDQCWVPDVEKEPSLSGRLGHMHENPISTKYMGIISRFEKKDLPLKYDIMVLLSGPEPQRSLLEEKLLTEIGKYKGQVLFVRGKIEPEQIVKRSGNTVICNFMIGSQLEETLNSSKTVLSRSGYTTILDLAKLGKKAFFIPTPGQFEQEYLAERCMLNKLVPSCTQDEFKIEMLDQLTDYAGFKVMNTEVNYKDLFSLFEGE